MKFLKDLKFNRKKALENKKFLKQGVYVLLPNMRTYVRFGTYRQVSSVFPKGEKGLKAMIKRVISLFFSFTVKSNGAFEGEVVYFATIPNPDSRNFKVFSLKNKKVRIFFPHQKRYDSYVNHIDKLKEFYPIPKLYELNESELYVIEEYIVRKKQMNVTPDAIRSLFEFYSEYYEKCFDADRYVDTIENNDSLLSHVTSDECPFLFLHHGDLSSDNYIFNPENKELIFFDFDHEDWYPPFYDLCFLIFDMCFSKRNDILLRLFDKGTYDEYISEYAKRSGVSEIAVIKTCITYLWHKRLQTYSAEKLLEFQTILTETVQKMKGRLLNGKCHEQRNI